MFFEKLILQKNIYVDSLKKVKKSLFSFNIMSFRNKSIVFLNSNFKVSYIYVFLFFFEVLNNKSIIFFLDSRLNFKEFLWSIFLKKLKFQNFNFLWLKSLLTNFDMYIEYHIQNKLKIWKIIPDFIILFDLVTNYTIVKEANQLNIPIICFYGTAIHYSNLYKINNSLNIRTFYFFISFFFNLYIFFLKKKSRFWFINSQLDKK